MILLDAAFPTPEENLACDEALLDACEAAEIEGELLRFWESPEYFVVLGYTGKIAEEADEPACRQRHIPILRRCSGGGTVVQGPGCLNYSLILRINNSSVAGITETNRYVMSRNADTLSRVLGVPVERQGHTDLTVGNKKFSGNAQRRRQKYLLFHGTFLIDFDLPLIQRVLRPPPKQPDYREQRPHNEFVMNLDANAHEVKSALTGAWRATEECTALPRQRMKRLIETKYLCEEWNRKF